MSKSYVLKVVSANMTTRAGFKWGKVGEETFAPDWSPIPECGGGLHGWLNGIGDISCQCISDEPDALWLVLEVESSRIVDLQGKVKFPSAKTVFLGSMAGAAAFIVDKTVETGPVIGITRVGGDCSTNTGGYRSTNTGGYCSTNMGGYCSTNTGGDHSTNMGGYGSTNMGGDCSTNTGRDHSTNTGRDHSTNTGGYGSTNTGGDCSTNTGGDYSTNTGGDYSMVSGGYRSVVSGGYGSILQLTYSDERRRIATAYVGENGIKPNTFYRLNAQHEFEEFL